MGVVTANRLNRFMSEPRWSAAQVAEAEQVCVETEEDLSAALYGAVISPEHLRETVPVTRDGRVELSLPVFELIAVDGVPGVDGSAPAGYRLSGRHLWTAVATPLLGAPMMDRRGPLDIGQVTVEYMGGWGDQPALVNAILRVASARMKGRHSNTVGVVGLTAQTPPAEAGQSTTFTEADLVSLNRFRRLGHAGSGA